MSLWLLAFLALVAGWAPPLAAGALSRWEWSAAPAAMRGDAGRRVHPRRPQSSARRFTVSEPSSATPHNSGARPLAITLGDEVDGPGRGIPRCRADARLEHDARALDAQRSTISPGERSGPLPTPARRRGPDATREGASTDESSRRSRSGAGRVPGFTDHTDLARTVILVAAYHGAPVPAGTAASSAIQRNSGGSDTLHG